MVGSVNAIVSGTPIENGVDIPLTDAQSSEERPSILYIWILRSEHHRKAGNGDQRRQDVTPTSSPRLVSDEPQRNRQDRRRSIWWYRQQVRNGTAILRKACLDNGRDEKTESVERSIIAHVDHGEGPGLPVLDRLPEVGHLELLVVGAGLPVEFQAADYAFAVIIGEELGFVWEVVDHPVTRYTNENRSETLEDKLTREDVSRW